MARTDRQFLAIRDYRVYPLDHHRCFYDSKDNQVMLRLNMSQHSPSCVQVNYLNKEEESRFASQVAWQIQSIETVLGCALLPGQQQNLQIRFDVIKSDGLLLDCLVNLLAFGLVHQAVALNQCFSSCVSALDSENNFILDPTLSEVQGAKAVMLLVLSKDQRLFYCHYDNRAQVSWEEFFLESLGGAKQHNSHHLDALRQVITQ